MGDQADDAHAEAELLFWIIALACNPQSGAV